MRQFFQGDDTSFADLERRARTGCVVFPSQEMPRGANPASARVGFQIDERSGEALLLVDRGVVWPGIDPAVRRWLEEGTKRFPNFRDMRRWIETDLQQCFGTAELRNSRGIPRRTPGPGDPSRLTDLSAVQATLRQAAATPHWDEQELLGRLATVVRGQDAALERLVHRVCLHASRRQPRRPATFFAVGPTGVGKTKAAETLAAALGDAPGAGGAYGYLRLDMSEYQERHRVSQLLGAPQGYVGYGDGAQLVDALGANPRTVVLFDEIEKAHPDILRAVMNAMDAGRLSSSAHTRESGRSIDCRQAIFLFTSNLDADGIVRELGEKEAFDDAAQVDDVCRKQLRNSGVAPELIGRMGCFLVFRPIGEETRAEVVTLAVAAVAREYGLVVRFIDPGVIARIVQATRTENLGARPYEYAVDDLLGDHFARAASDRDVEVEIRATPELRVESLTATD